MERLTAVLTHFSVKPTLLSLNRFERKKNAALAVRAFAGLKAKFATKPLRLVLAGKGNRFIRDLF